MTYTLTVTTNLHTKQRRLYINGVRVSQVTFDTYRAIGCFFTESNKRVRKHHSVGVKR